MSLARQRSVVPALIGLTSATAWIVLWRLGESPWGHWAHAHGAAIQGATTALSSVPIQGVAFVAAWVVMTAAMMLPTTLPLVGIVGRITAGRADATRLVLLVVAGYLAVWMALGVVVFALATALRSAAGANGWVASHPWAPAAALFLVAGVFQFTPLKRRCLEKCRSPFGFVTSRWRGTRARWNAWSLGIEHGLFCVGCCWALMLLMFVSSAASLLWMLAIGGVMAIEKNAPWGRHLSAPLGVALIAAGAAVLVWQI